MAGTARYMKNSAPIGGWIDRQTGTSFTDDDPYNAVYREFVKWCEENGQPDEDDTPITARIPLDYSTIPDDTNDRARLQQALNLFDAYIKSTTPTEAQRKAWENTITRVVAALARKVL